MNLEYDMEAAMELLTACNFRCSYCFHPPHALNSPIKIYGTTDQWREGFDATGKTWLLHISGGEPTLYPEFVNFCERFSQNHYLSVTSNLSHKRIDNFAEKINPERVHYIHAAVHYDERRKISSSDNFIDRVKKLRNNGFTVLVSLVMTPEVVESFPKISDFYESHGIFPIPKVMRGKYQGRKYPAAYSPDEKSCILEYLTEAQRKYAPVLAGMTELPTANPLTDNRLLNNPGAYYGRMCGSGYNFVRIEPDGTVLRCSSRIRLGNILQKNVRFLRFPLPCYSSYCPYYCEKYTSSQFMSGKGFERNSLLHWIKRAFAP